MNYKRAKQYNDLDLNLMILSACPLSVFFYLHLKIVVAS
jgi:hypothetical protein